MTPQSTGQQDLRTYLRIFWRWKLLFAAFVILIPLGVHLVERSKPKVYQSSTLIALQNVTAGSGGISVAPTATANLAAFARLVTTTPVVAAAARLLHRPPGSLSSEVSAKGDTNTGFLTITAQGRNPVRAAAVANAFAAALANHQAAQASRQINEQVKALRRQLAVTPRSQPGTRITLRQQIAQMQAVNGAAASGAQVVQAAAPSGTPVSPRTRRAVELALVIALLLGVGAVLVAENADRRVRTSDDVEGLTGWPLLAPIPPSAFSPEHLADPRDEEAFEMFRGALTYFNVENPLRSVAMISPLPGDGKTTVAAGLAIAAARAGKRAILVDGDLRRSGVCARLGITEGAGLGAVLAGEQEVADVMTEYPVDAPGGGQLLVLGAGPPPPNPAALLGSQRMREVVRELETWADLVILDTVAALAVSDPLPLLKTVSGSVIVVRMNRSSRAAVRRLQKMIVSAEGTVLGFVATGSAAVGGYGGYYPYVQDGVRGGALGLLHLRRWRPRPDVNSASSNGAVTPEAGARDEQPAATEAAVHGESPSPDA
jgi:capsular exopolysaccharide synthesis family protein